MGSADDDRFTDLEAARRGRLPRRRWTGTGGQRARAARRLPQAVFKISSWSRSGGAVMGRFQYITREGEVEAEGPTGERLEPERLAHLVDMWSEEARPTQRQALSAVLSFPAAVDEEQATEAARQFFRAAFADNHDYVFAPHRDTNNFHVHVVVQAAGLDGKQLRIGRADLQDLRMLMAEKAAEQGIELDASPRWARGLEAERRPGVKIEGMMRRFQSPEQALERAWLLGASHRTQLEALAAVRGGPDAARPVSPLEYARAGECLVMEAQGQEERAEQVQRMKAGVELTRLGLTLSARAERGEHFNAAESAAVVAVAGAVDQALAAQIRELPADVAPALKREAWHAREPLADHLAALRPTPERRWAREAETPAEQAPAVQALEYAREAERVAGQLDTLTHDQDRVAAVKGAVSLARFGWELAERDQAPTPEQAQTRATIDTTERALRAAIHQIEDPQAKREAIQARATLYHAGVKEYREARRQERQRGLEAGAERKTQQEEVEHERTRPGPERERGAGHGVGGAAGGHGAGARPSARRAEGVEPGAGEAGGGLGEDAELVRGAGGGSSPPALGLPQDGGPPGHGADGAEQAPGTPARAVEAGVEPGPVEGGAGERGRGRGRELDLGDGLGEMGAAGDGAGRGGGEVGGLSGVVGRGDPPAAGADSAAKGKDMEAAEQEGGRGRAVEQASGGAGAELAARVAARRAARLQEEQEQREREQERERKREQERERERDTGPELEP